MEKIKTKIFIIVILNSLCGSIFAATATCSAQNKSTGQLFTASGNGDSQVSASQDAQNIVMQICKQASNSAPDGCEVSSCTSF